MNLALSDTIIINHYNEVKLYFSKNDFFHIQQLLESCGWDKKKPLIHVHPTSRWLFKCWKDEYTAEVVDWLGKRGYQVTLTAAPIDIELQRVDRIIYYCNSKPINLAGNLNLKQLAALSSLSDMFFGVDSAPMHIAASQNTPVIAVFGPSGSFNWGPWPNKHKSQHNPYPSLNGVQRTGSHIVIQQSWDCVPCGQDGCDGSKKSRCLDELTPEMIIPLIQQHISENL